MEFLQAVSEWPVASYLRRNEIAYILLNATHIVSIGLIIGSIVALDLRILGAFRRIPLDAMATPLSLVGAIGVLLAITSGLGLFSVRPTAYVQNPAFLTKITLVGLGVVNAVALNLSASWARARAGATPTTALRLSAFLSMFFWAGAILAGRWIGFL
ncbi:MAG: DUF2214 domain-containing protein [Phyllobacterium sp.]